MARVRTKSKERLTVYGTAWCLDSAATRRLLNKHDVQYKYVDINKDAKIVQVDIEPTALGKYFPIEIGMIGDAGSVAGAIADGLSDLSADSVPWKARSEKFLKDIEALWVSRDEAGQSTLMPLRAA